MSVVLALASVVVVLASVVVVLASVVVPAELVPPLAESVALTPESLLAESVTLALESLLAESVTLTLVSLLAESVTLVSLLAESVALTLGSLVGSVAVGSVVPDESGSVAVIESVFDALMLSVFDTVDVGVVFDALPVSELALASAEPSPATPSSEQPYNIMPSAKQTNFRFRIETDLQVKTDPNTQLPKLHYTLITCDRARSSVLYADARRGRSFSRAR